MQKLGMEEGQEIEHPFITRAIQTAQTRVEGRNFEIRKQLLEYDNVMNRQREVIYAERRKVLEGEDLREHFLGMIEEVMDAMTAGYSPQEEDAFKGLAEMARKIFPIPFEGIEAMSGDELTEALIQRAKAAYENKEKTIGVDFLRHLERIILLDVVDSKWKDHLRSMDNLREGIGLRAYGQKDPLVEYKREAFEAFQEMVHVIKEDTLAFIFRVQPAVRAQGDQERVPSPMPAKKAAPLQFIHPEASSAVKNAISAADGQKNPDFAEESVTTPTRSAVPSEKKVGRNDPCPCGSGKKYKKCHGQ